MLRTFLQGKHYERKYYVKRRKGGKGRWRFCFLG